MFRMKYYILLTLCWLLSAAAMAQVGEKMSFGLRPGGDGTYRLDFATGHIGLSRNGEGYGVLVSDGMVGLAPGEGMPALPRASRLLALPRGTELRVERVDEGGSEPLLLPSGMLLAPWSGAAVKDAEPVEAKPDKAVYAADSLVRWGNPVEVENLGAMGDRQLFRVTVHPVAYNPASGEVAISTGISATLLTSGLPVPTGDSRLPRRYLIVSRPQFRDGLQPFVCWKRQEGYDVEEIYSETNQRDSVKALIEAAFGDGLVTPWPQCMLIVGDAEQIQAYVGTTRPSGLGTHPTDLYYADHTGDGLPDVLYGRWPVNDTSELHAVVDKTLRYERGIDLDTVALRRALLVAGHENTSPAPVTTNGQVNYLKRRIKQTIPEVDTVCYYNPASSGQRDAILSDIDNGASLLNYTAHCTAAGWSNPAVSYSSIDTLADRPMVYVNNCCQSNNFTGTCFGEQLLRKPQGGGVAVIGATNSTLWNEDYYWAVGPKYPFSYEPQYDSLRPGAFDRWFAGEVATAGGLLVAGNMAVTAFGSPHDRFYWEIYTLFGDPALVPWLGVPQRVLLSVADTIAVGTMELRVSGTPGATVTAVQGCELLGAVLLDDHRSSLLQLRRPVDTLPVTFTATLPGMLPRETTVPSSMPRGKSVAFTETTLGGNTVCFTVANLGTDTLFDVTVALAEADSGMMYASVASDTVAFDTLLPQTSHAGICLPFHIDRWAPILAVALTATDADGDSWRLTINTTLGDTLPEMLFTIRNADTSVAAGLQRGGTYIVGVTPVNLFDTLHYGVANMPDGASFEGDGSWLPVAVGDSSTHLRLAGFISRGNYSREYEYFVNVGTNTDGFGNGMDAYPWQGGGTLPWTVDGTESHSGRYSLRSGAIGSRQTSDLLIDILLPSDDSVAFWTRTSSEPNYDKLQFSIDGVKVMEKWGQTTWKRYSFPLAAGHHRLCWRYGKDESTSEGSDCAWLDDVQLPLALWSVPCGAGAADEGVGSIDDPEAPKTTVYPNPSSGRVTVVADSRIETLRLIDLYGRVVFSSAPLSATVTLDLDGLPGGLYIVELHSADGTSHTKLNLQHR